MCTHFQNHELKNADSLSLNIRALHKAKRRRRASSAKRAGAYKPNRDTSRIKQCLKYPLRFVGAGRPPAVP